MKPFPPTASLPVDHRYEAALEALNGHRIDQCANGSSFTMPASAIQSAARIAGKAVRPLLRSNPSKATVHSDDLLMPWIEIEGVYTFQTEDGPCAIMVIAVSANYLIKEYLLKSEDGAVVTENTEKVCLVKTASRILRQFLSASAAKQVKDCLDNPEQAIIRRDLTILRLKQLTVSKSDDPSERSDRYFSSGMLFVSDRLDPDSVRAILGDSEISVLQVRELPEFLTGKLMVWRTLFGTGWLTRVDHFVRTLESAIRSKHIEDHLQVHCDCPNRGGAAELAVVATAKLVMHGWLPSQCSSSATTAGSRGVAGRFIQVPSGSMTDGDISIFKLPRLIFPGEHDLRLRTPEERLRASWGHFQTPHAQDEVFLYFDHSGYGEREVDVLDFKCPDPTDRRLMPIGFLHPISLSILRSILPALQIDVVGYASASSTTTRSAVLERLLRLVSLQASDPVHHHNLREEVARLLAPSELKKPRESTHMRCMELDGLIQANQPGDSSACTSCADVLPESWPRKLLRKLLMAGRGHQAPNSEVFGNIVMLASILFEIRAEQFKDLILSKEKSHSHEVGLVIALYKMISFAAKENADVRRTQGSRFNHLLLRKNMAIMIRDAVKGRIAIPDSLATWLTKHVKVTCVMGLDPINSGLLPEPKMGRAALAGSFHSYRLYKHLFHPEAVKSSIEVDLTALLDYASYSLAEGNEGKPGWLANKISQTNELMAHMMVQTGHLEDFPYGEMLSPKTARNVRSMLSVLPAQLIVRCILGEQGGRECLDHWAQDICAMVARHWRDDIAGSTKVSPVLSSDSAAILEVFRDVEGLATAALNCCRKRFVLAGGAKQRDMRLSVYFLPDELRNQFRKPMLTKSLGVRSVQKR